MSPPTNRRAEVMNAREQRMRGRVDEPSVAAVCDTYLDELHRALKLARSVPRETSWQRERLSARFARRAKAGEPMQFEGKREGNTAIPHGLGPSLVR